MLRCILESDKDYKIIQHINSPDFSVFFFTKGQLEVLLSLHKKKKIVVAHLDATGGIIRNPALLSSTLLIYALVTNIDGIIFSFLEGALSRHSTFHVSQLLKHFVMEAMQISYFKTHQCIHEVITDYCLAEVNGVVEAFNQMRYLAYLVKMYEIMKKMDTEAIKKITTVHLCTSHFCKMDIKDVRKYFKDPHTVNIVVEILGALLEIIDWNQAIAFWNIMVTIFCEETRSPEFLEAFYQIFRVKEDQMDSDCEDYKIPEHLTPEEFLLPKDLDGKPMFKQSPFFNVFTQVKDDYFNEKRAENPKKSEPNAFYCPAFVDFLLKKYLSIFPLWSNIPKYLRRKNKNFARSNNGNVEGFFGAKKNLLRRSQREYGVMGNININDYVDFIKDGIDVNVTTVL
jgi:hypothetical protein